MDFFFLYGPISCPSVGELTIAVDGWFYTRNEAFVYFLIVDDSAWEFLSFFNWELVFLKTVRWVACTYTGIGGGNINITA